MTGVPPRLRQKPRARRSALLALLAAGASLLVAERGSATNPIVTTITTAGETAYVIPANTISLQVTVVGAPGASAGVSAGHPVGTPGTEP